MRIMTVHASKGPGSAGGVSSTAARALKRPASAAADAIRKLRPALAAAAICGV